MGGGDSNINGDGSSSSGEEDGDAAWKAAINSVATVGFGLSASNGRSKPDPTVVDSSEDDDDDATAQLHRQGRWQAPKLKLYQIKVHISSLDEAFRKARPEHLQSKPSCLLICRREKERLPRLFL